MVVVTLTVDETNGAVGVGGGGGGGGGTPVPVPHHNPLMHNQTPSADGGSGGGGIGGTPYSGTPPLAPRSGTPPLGRAVQVDPIRPKLRPPGTKRLKLNCDALL